MFGQEGVERRKCRDADRVVAYSGTVESLPVEQRSVGNRSSENRVEVGTYDDGITVSGSNPSTNVADFVDGWLQPVVAPP